MTDNVSLDSIKTNEEFDLVTLYESYEDNDGTMDNDSPFQYSNSTCMYYEPSDFLNQANLIKDPLSFYHLNCRGLSSNWESFHSHLCDLHGDTFSFDFIGISEIYQCCNDSRLSLPGYHDLIVRCRDDGPRGGVGLFMIVVLQQ